MGDLAGEEADGPAESIARCVVDVAGPAGGLGCVAAARGESGSEAVEDVAGAGGSKSDSSTGGCPPASVGRGDTSVDRHDGTSSLRGRGR